MANPIRYRGYGFHSRVVPKSSPPQYPQTNHIRQLDAPKTKPVPLTSIVLETEIPEPEPDPNMIQYEIRVATGDILGAGTDANVYITVFGTEGETDKLQLTKKFTNLFERGRTDCFIMDLPNDLGKLTKLRVEHDDTGFGSAWLLERMDITNMTTLETTIFFCGDWLDSNHGTLRDLLPMPVTPEDE